MLKKTLQQELPHNRKSISGKKFNKLTALRFSYHRKGRYYWLRLKAMTKRM